MNLHFGQRTIIIDKLDSMTMWCPTIYLIFPILYLIFRIIWLLFPITCLLIYLIIPIVYLLVPIICLTIPSSSLSSPSPASSSSLPPCPHPIICLIPPHNYSQIAESLRHVFGDNHFSKSSRLLLLHHRRDRLFGGQSVGVLLRIVALQNRTDQRQAFTCWSATVNINSAIQYITIHPG